MTQDDSPNGLSIIAFLDDWVRQFGSEQLAYALMNPKSWTVMSVLVHLATQVGAVWAHPKRAIAGVPLQLINIVMIFSIGFPGQGIMLANLNFNHAPDREGRTSMSVSDRRRQEFDYVLECGRNTNAALQTTPAVLLIGGAEEGRAGEQAATQWFLKRAAGGDYLVLRFGDPGEQAAWICDRYRELVSSSAELAINSREAANHPDVSHYIRNAEALFLAGGDQNKYEDYWEGTAVEDAVNYLLRKKKVPIAGTSAGMAILGDYYYAPSRDGVLSSEILNNPFHSNTKDIYRSDFIRVPILQQVITDTHLDRVDEDHPETRYGRIFGFLARILYDTGNQFPVRGIGLEEGAFVAIDEHGIARVFGNGTEQGQDAYFLQANDLPPEQIQPDQPLIWNHNGQAVKVYTIAGTPSGSGKFDLNDWSTASGGRWEYWFTTGGASGFKRQPIR